MPGICPSFRKLAPCHCRYGRVFLCTRWDYGVCGTHSIYFVHGTENTMFLHERIEDFVVTQPNAELVSLEGTAQLSIFEQPEKLVDTLAALAKWQ